MDHFKENTSSKDMKKKKIRCFQCKKKLNVNATNQMSM